MTLAEQLREVVRGIPHAISTAMWRLAYRQHHPTDVMGDQSRAYCLTCDEDWPCRGWLRVDDARDEAGHKFTR